MATLRTTLAQLMSSLTGLDYQVALNWLNAENSQVGHGTNPLGIQCGNSRGSGLEIGCQPASGGRSFAIYRSSLDGIRAAAWMLTHIPRYSHVIAAIRARDPAAQRLALVQSGWAAGGYHGGSGFSGGGITGSIPTGAGGGGPAPNATLASSTTYTAAQWNAFIACVNAHGAQRYVGAGNVALIQSCATSTNVSLAGVTLSDFYGKSFSDLRDALAAKGVIPPASLLPDLADLAAGVMVNAAVLVVILVLAYRGVRELLG